jgi:hypothetical protein
MDAAGIHMYQAILSPFGKQKVFKTGAGDAVHEYFEFRFDPFIVMIKDTFNQTKPCNIGPNAGRCDSKKKKIGSTSCHPQK